MRNVCAAVICGLAVLAAGTAQAQQEPVFRGIQPKQAIIDALQRDQKISAPAPETLPRETPTRETTSGETPARPSTHVSTTSRPSAPAATRPHRPAVEEGVALSYLIVFEYNSAALTDTARQQLDGVAEAFKSNELAGSRFRIEGHADAVGSEAFNLALSKRRAQTVVEYLVDVHGISPAKLSAVGVGERDLYNPADPTAEENRRVRFIRYAG